MASKKYVDTMQSKLDALREIEEERLMRSFLGGDLPLSENKAFVEQRKKIEQRMEIAIKFGHEVSDTQMQNINGIMDRIVANIKDQSDSTSNRAYIDNQPSFLENITLLMEEMNDAWVPFASCLAEYTYSTDSAHAIEKQIEEFAKGRMESIREQSDQIRDRVTDEANSIIENAKKEANKLKKDAEEALEGIRLTATGKSVEGAQEQFRTAQSEIDRNKKIWAVLSILGAITFVAFACLYTPDNMPEKWEWSMLYHSTIKISILAIIGAAISFFVKMFRAHLYMSAKNKHRIRIANSVEAFVSAASTADQKDLILSQLVDSVTQFGPSGLLSKEEDGQSKMPLESLLKNIFTKSTQ